jgi:hypothetical protein
MDGETWLEDWQVSEEECGTPVAPHDGTQDATWEYNEEEITISGTGAYLGIPKAVNAAELTTPGDAPASITYMVLELADDGMKLTVAIEAVGTGVWWTFRLAKEIS